MDNVTFIEITNPLSGDVTEHAIIDRGNGEFTSMPKSIYDELKANEAAKTF
jgi:predicted aspartyl protease